MKRPLLWLLAFAMLAALPFAAKAFGFVTLVPVLTRMFIYGIAALSLNLLMGYGGMASFGHAAFYGIGGYVVAVLYQHARESELIFGILPGTMQLLLTLPLAMIVSGLAAALIGALSVRTSGVQFIMITLAFAQMVFFLFVGLKAYGGDDGLPLRTRNELFGLNMRDDANMYWVVLAALALSVVVNAHLVTSRFGMVLQGIRQNERRMAALGIDAYRYKLAAFVIAGMGAGLAGALQVNFARFVSPDMLGWAKSGELMVMVILGGVGTLLGPVVGAGALLLLEKVLGEYTEHWQMLLGPILVITVLFARGGLMGLWSRLWRRP